MASSRWEFGSSIINFNKVQRKRRWSASSSNSEEITLGNEIICSGPSCQALEVLARDRPVKVAHIFEETLVVNNSIEIRGFPTPSDGNYCSAVKCLPSETDQRFFMVVHEIRPNGTLGSQIGKKRAAKSDQGQPVPRDGIRFMWKALPKQVPWRNCLGFRCEGILELWLALLGLLRVVNALLLQLFKLSRWTPNYLDGSWVLFC